jgi:probable addiction module antidote protein
MPTELFPFDPAEFLNDDESQAEYLSIAFESGDPAQISHALAVIARARGGVGNMAAETGTEPELLASIVNGEKDPGLAIVLKIMNALGIKLSASKVA